MLNSKTNPTEIKVGIRSIKTLRDGRMQIETGSIQEAETQHKGQSRRQNEIEHIKTTKVKNENTQHTRGNTQTI